MRVPEGVEFKTTKEYKIHPNIFSYTLGSAKTGHPAVFPNKLANDMICSFSNENDIVLDPFSGSGTTLLESKNLNRKYIGFEIVKEYYDLCKERIQKEIKNEK